MKGPGWKHSGLFAYVSSRVRQYVTFQNVKCRLLSCFVRCKHIREAMMRRSFLTLLVCTTAMVALPVYAASDEMPAIIVTASEADSLTVPNNADATYLIQQTPGG